MSSENVYRLNQILDSANYKASIRTKRDAVYIRGTFIGADGKKVRKEIALNAKIYDFTTCRDRIRDFYLEYEKKGYLPKVFSWNKTLEVKEVRKNTVEYGIEKFKEDYWESKGNPSEEEKNSESKRTLISYSDQLRKLEKYNDLELTPELLRTVIEEKSSPNTKPRQDMYKIFKRLGKLFFIESDLKDLDKIRGKYIPKKRIRLDDAAIVEEIDKIRDTAHQFFETAVIKKTEGPGHASLLSKEACEQGFDIVAAVGGDGTCNEVVNGMISEDELISEKTCFALLPF